MHVVISLVWLSVAAPPPAVTEVKPPGLTEVSAADAQWRRAAKRGVKGTAQQRELDAATRVFEQAIAVARTSGRFDEIWGEAEGSLGLLLFARHGARGWRQAWPHVQRGLKYWADQANDERYRRLALEAAFPSWANASFYRYFQVRLPGDVIQRLEGMKLNAADAAAVNFLVAMSLFPGRRPQSADRAEKAIVAALTAGASVEWYDDALFAYAQFLEQCGLDVGSARSCQPDYHRALELYRRLVKEQPRSIRIGPTKSRIAWITRIELAVGMSQTFLPGSEIPLQLNWRNVKELDVELYRVDLIEDRGSGTVSWPQKISLSGKEPIAAWKEPGDVKCAHVAGSRRVLVESKLGPGAYVISVRGAPNDDVGGAARTARSGFLITDLTLLLRADRRQIATWLVNAFDGKPVADAKVAVWGPSGRSRGTTDKDGRARFDLGSKSLGRSAFAAASVGEQQVFATTTLASYPADQWRLLAIAERPAFRPGDKVHYRGTLRIVRRGDLVTPSGQQVAFEVRDSRRQVVSKGTARLNSYGSFTGELQLTDKMALGEYRVAIKSTSGNKHQLVDGPLFRLEEYKLPEFVVTVSPPVKEQRAQVFKPGDKIEVDILVEHYFGGGVPDAAVQATVQMTPFTPAWEKQRDQPWLYPATAAPHTGGSGWVVTRQSLKTDAKGKATLKFEAPKGQRGNMEYWITATVTDSSRRQVSGSGSVRVTEEPYFVFAEAQREVWGPGDKPRIDFVTFDGNKNPIPAEGDVTVDRIFATGAPTYQRDPVEAGLVASNTMGRAFFEFSPPTPGYYQVLWRRKSAGQPAAASVLIHVAAEGAADLGYRSGSIEIIPDRDTYKPGDTALLLIHAPKAPKVVWLALEGDVLYQDQVIHLTDFAATVRVPIEKKHAPFLFFTAQAVNTLRIEKSATNVVVLPPDTSLRVGIDFDADSYRPGAKGKARITVKDVRGKPVRAEVSLGVFDEAVLAIQPEYIGDPRPLLLTAVRESLVRGGSTFEWRPYVRLVGERLQPETFGAASFRVPHLPPILEKVTFDPGLRETVVEAPEPVYEEEDYGAPSMAAAEPSADFSARSAPAPSAASSSRSAKRSQPRARVAKPTTRTTTPSAQSFVKPSSVKVRTDFRATVYWNPSIVTNSAGRAEVPLGFPESLTRWQATAFGVSRGPDVGRGSAQVRTNQPLMIRLQAPRFFVVGDQLTLSAIVNNRTEKALRLAVSLKAPMLEVTRAIAGKQVATGTEIELELGPESEQRVDFDARVTRIGPTPIEVMVRSTKESDGMKKSLLAYAHGIDKLLAAAGEVRGKGANIAVELPPRAPGSTAMTVQVTPSLAVTMLDALPYLVTYPYSSTDQTISRFVPLALVRRTLKDLGMKPADVQSRVFGGIEAAHASATHPRGKGDLTKLDTVIDNGLVRIYDMRRTDKGWGWWKENTSDPFISAYVLWGLLLAREAGVKVKPEVLREGISFLEWQLDAATRDIRQVLVLRRQAVLLRELLNNPELKDPGPNPEQLEIQKAEVSRSLAGAEQTMARVDFNQVAWLLHVLSVDYDLRERQSPSDKEMVLFRGAYEERARLSSYGVALLALAAHNYHQKEEAGLLADLLIETAKHEWQPSHSRLVRHQAIEGSGELEWAFWGEPAAWRRWYQSPVESTAMALRALLRIRPEHTINERAMTWLVVNRRGAQWNNTRDTAISIYALTDYMKRRRPPASGAAYRVTVNGKEVARQRLSGAKLLRAPSRVEVPEKLLVDGDNQIVVENLGRSRLYYSVYATFFSLEEPVVAAGNLLFVERDYTKLPPAGAGGAPVPLTDGARVYSGDRIGVRLTLEAKNELEYLVFEDLKPAGFEAVEVQSGRGLSARHFQIGARRGGQQSRALDRRQYTGQQQALYRELRDRHEALFARRLSPGFWEINYELRAEVPGEFHALPLLGRAMYVPEVRGNGTEVRVKVLDGD